ncbi:MAG: ATP-binding protein [Deltaproteobacteria bacterium]|nr:ATP-binding protein [Deltaproteobacteria bacterium]
MSERARDEHVSDFFERIEVSTAVDGSAPTKPSTPRERSPTPSRGRPLYRADPDRVLRVLAANQFDDPFLAFRELYANALDACRGRSGAAVEVRVAPDRVVVTDTGAGIDEAGLEAMTTLGGSTRRGADAIGRFGIGFASIFDPALGVARVDFTAVRLGYDGTQPAQAAQRAQAGPPAQAAPSGRGARGTGVRIRFEPEESGGVSILVDDVPWPKGGGTRVEVVFSPARAPEDRVARITKVFEVHAAYSGVETILNGRSLGRELADYIRDEVRDGAWTEVERSLVTATAVRGPVGVAAIDPSRAESKFQAYHRGLFVCEIPLARMHGRPWPRGVFGAVNAEGLELVASRNAFVENERFTRFQAELQKLAQEAAYRAVRYFETTEEPFARLVLLDSLRRGLRTATPEGLLVESTDLFSGAAVRAPIFRAWGGGRHYTFEELVALKAADRFRATSYRPARWEAEGGPIMRADDSVERDIFRRLSGMKEMPAAARAEDIAQPSMLSRLRDRLMSGPRAEYSLFQRAVDPRTVTPGLRALVDALTAFLGTPEVSEAIARLVPGPLPHLGFGCSRNAFGPVAAYRMGEIRFNSAHRIIRRLARVENPEIGARALLPVLAHELAHMCHELHDLDFYRTSRTLLRALVTAAARIDARRLGQASP